MPGSSFPCGIVTLSRFQIILADFWRGRRIPFCGLEQIDGIWAGRFALITNH
jgi:hypothetical protein